MNWKKLAIISFVLFAIGFLMIGTQNEINLIVKVGAIILFFSLFSPVIMKLWFSTEKTGTQKAVLGLFIVLILYLLTIAVIPPRYGGKLPTKSGAGQILPQ